MAGDPRISIRAALLSAVLAAAAAFHAAAESFKAAAESDETDKAKLTQQLSDANSQLDDAHSQLATAQTTLAQFQNETKAEDNPDLMGQINALGVTDGDVVTPAADLPPDAGTGGDAAPAGGTTGG